MKAKELRIMSELDLDNKMLEDSGFLLLDQKGSILIPNYFEPFINENIAIHFAYKCSDSRLRPLLFKGDADQDRPN